MSITPSKTALVLGATGGIGGAIAHDLARRGWRVRALHRQPEDHAADAPDFEWVAGDALDRDSVLRAADGAGAIVHGVNPPGYRNWAGTVVPMLDNTIAAAAATGARVVLPGTLYNYGPDAFGTVAEDAPQNPLTRKGKLRVTMERSLEAAAGEGRIRALVLRAGDYFGPGKIANSWFTQIVKPDKPVRSVLYPGPQNVPHAWAYLPDLGAAFGQLLEREAELSAFARFHFAGHSLTPGIALAEAIEAATGRPLSVHRLPWIALKLLAPFSETLRETVEMKYLWFEDVRLDNRKLVAFLGAEPHTPLVEAIRTTLAAQGSLDGAGA